MKQNKYNKVLAIDPGPDESAYVYLYSNPLNILDKGKFSNLFLKRYFKKNNFDVEIVLIEMVSSYGMSVGQEVFDNCVIIGEFKQLFENKGLEVQLIFRKTVKYHLCQSVRANDGEVNKTLIQRYGNDSTKKNPNLFYETSNKTWMNGDIYSALALATYAIEPKDYPLQNLQETEERKLSKSFLMTEEEHIQYLLDEKERKKIAAKK